MVAAVRAGFAAMPRTILGDLIKARISKGSKAVGISGHMPPRHRFFCPDDIQIEN
ncbi:MAG: hypothetical protein MI799_20530 [Desulfobacterales bacterium]|nr:hypothetical protein [Desulfobacterales bacterium]